MVNIKKLIADGNVNDAVEILYNGLRTLFNNHIPGVNLTRDEFAAVTPTLLNKLQDPGSITKEPTDAPGDDIEIVPSKGRLTIHFVGPEGDEDFRAPYDVSKAYNVGATYTYLVPTVAGYTADQTEVTGIMTADGVEETVTYAKNENSEVGGGDEDGDSDGGDEGDETPDDEEEEKPLVYGSVETITTGGSINGADPANSTITYEKATLNWSAANAAAGRNRDGWWIGIKVNAPDDMTTEEQFAGVTYKTRGSSGWSGSKNFWNAQDSNKSTADTKRYLTMWGVVDETYIKNALEKDGVITYAWQFDWNADGEYEQLVELIIKAEDLVLTKDGDTVYPPKAE